MGIDKIIFFGLLLGIGLLIFFVLRRFVLWYYKIDERLKIQKEILAQLQKMNGEEIEEEYEESDKEED